MIESLSMGAFASAWFSYLREDDSKKQTIISNVFYLLIEKYPQEYQNILKQNLNARQKYQLLLWNASDIVPSILQYLHIYDLCQCSLVSSHWLYHAFDSNSLYSFNVRQYIRHNQSFWQHIGHVRQISVHFEDSEYAKDKNSSSSPSCILMSNIHLFKRIKVMKLGIALNASELKMMNILSTQGIDKRLECFELRLNIYKCNSKQEKDIATQYVSQFNQLNLINCQSVTLPGWYPFILSKQCTFAQLEWPLMYKFPETNDSNWNLNLLQSECDTSGIKTLILNLELRQQMLLDLCKQCTNIQTLFLGYGNWNVSRLNQFIIKNIFAMSKIISIKLMAKYWTVIVTRASSYDENTNYNDMNYNHCSRYEVNITTRHPTTSTTLNNLFCNDENSGNDNDNDDDLNVTSSFSSGIESIQFNFKPNNTFQKFNLCHFLFMDNFNDNYNHGRNIIKEMNKRTYQQLYSPHPTWSKIDSVESFRRHGVELGKGDKSILGWKVSKPYEAIVQVEALMISKTSGKLFLQHKGMDRCFSNKKHGYHALPNDCLCPAPSEQLKFIENDTHVSLFKYLKNLTHLQLIKIQFNAIYNDLQMYWINDVLSFIMKLNADDNSSKCVGLKLNVSIPGIAIGNLTWDAMKTIFDNIKEMINLKIPIDLSITKVGKFRHAKEMENSKQSFQRSCKNDFSPLFGNMNNYPIPNCNDGRFWTPINDLKPNYVFYQPNTSNCDPNQVIISFKIQSATCVS